MFRRAVFTLCFIAFAAAAVVSEAPRQAAAPAQTPRPAAAQPQTPPPAQPQATRGHPLGWIPGGPAPQPPPDITVLRVGRLLDPETATVTTNQMILIEGDYIKEIGPKVAIPPGATVIDLSKLTAMPGFVDTHHHLALANSSAPMIDIYLYYVQNSNPTRTVHALASAMDMLASGFTLIRDEGNAGLWIDTSLRTGFEQGWLPGPTIFNSGQMISPMGGQYGFPQRHKLTPEMYDRGIMYPEYLEADTPDEIIKAIRKNIMFGGKCVKVIMGDGPYKYSLEDMKLFVAEGAKSGQRVVAHVGGERDRRIAIEAGVWGTIHGGGATDELLALQAQKGIWWAGTEPRFSSWGGSTERVKRSAVTLRRVYDAKVKMTFSSDGDENPPDITRGEMILDILEVWKEAKIPNADIVRAITINGFKMTEIDHQRGPIKVGLAADIIAVPGNPLEDIDVLKNVQFVMKDGLVFKQNGLVSFDPRKAFRGGHVRRLPFPRKPTT